MTDDDDYDYPGGWFGPSWGAPVCGDSAHLPTPVGEECLHCCKVFVDGDQGLTVPHVAVEGVTLRSIHIKCFHVGLINPGD